MRIWWLLFWLQGFLVACNAPAPRPAPLQPTNPTPSAEAVSDLPAEVPDPSFDSKTVPTIWRTTYVLVGIPDVEHKTLAVAADTAENLTLGSASIAFHHSDASMAPETLPVTEVNAGIDDKHYSYLVVGCGKRAFYFTAIKADYMIVNEIPGSRDVLMGLYSRLDRILTNRLGDGGTKEIEHFCEKTAPWLKYTKETGTGVEKAP